MAQIFPKWTNKLPVIIILAVSVLTFVIIGLIWYFASPWYTDVGYQPTQPVEYSHKVHAGDMGIDCRYCHNYVETSPHANVPPTQTCMNCHKIVKASSEKMIPIMESWTTNQPMEWVRVHKLPDYAYFDHSAHLEAGVGCFSCHGNVTKMEKITLVQPLSMSWCLDCHRDPAPNLRPHGEVTNMGWIAPSDHAVWAKRQMEEKNIMPPTTCSGCHR